LRNDGPDAISVLRTSTGLRFEVPTDPTGGTPDPVFPRGTYTVLLQVKDLTVDGKTYRYFDFARAQRQ